MSKDSYIFCEGFSYAFDSSACARCKGKCCTGASGYIFVDKLEIDKLAKFLNITCEEFIARFAYKVGDKISLKEKPDAPSEGYACVFFDQINRCCGVYEARPKQCVSFPFWKQVSLKELCEECIGIVVL